MKKENVGGGSAALQCASLTHDERAVAGVAIYQLNTHWQQDRIMPILMLTSRRMKLSGERSRQRILQLRRDIITGLKLTRYSEEGPSRLDSLRRPRRKRGEGIFDSRRLYTNIARPCSAEMRHLRCTRNEPFGNFRPWFNHHSEKSPTKNTPSTCSLCLGLFPRRLWPNSSPASTITLPDRSNATGETKNTLYSISHKFSFSLNTRSPNKVAPQKCSVM